MDRMEALDLTAVPLPLARLSAQGMVRAVNAAFCASVNCAPDAVRSTPVWKLIPELSNTAWMKLMRAGEQLSTETIDDAGSARDGIDAAHARFVVTQCEGMHSGDYILLAGNAPWRLGVDDTPLDSDSLCSILKTASLFPALLVDMHQGHVIDCNPAFVRKFGWSPEAVVGQPASSLLGELPGLDELERGKVLNGSEFTTTLQRANHEESSVHLCLWSLMEGDREYLLAVARVPTPQEIDLPEGHDDFFRHIAGSLREVFYIVDTHTDTLAYVSPAYSTVFGRPEPAAGEPILSGWLAYVHAKDRERVIRAARSMPASRAIDETYRIVRPDGNVRWIRDRGFALHQDAGVDGRFAGVAEDITDFLHTLEALRLSEQRFANVFQANPDALTISLLSSGKLVDASRGFERITGFDRDEAIGKSLEDLGVWRDRREISRLGDELARHGRCFGIETTWSTSDGDKITCLMSAEVVQLDGVPHVVAVTKDVSDRRRMETTLRILAALPGAKNEADLYNTLGRELSRATDAGTVAIMSLGGRRHRAGEVLAAYSRGRSADVSEFKPSATLLSEVVSSGTYLIAENAHLTHP
ncbi:PAS domain S-box protein, partial [candidate division GN15 bacterium]|nr:PAS domain S-box protein [candidate division GN15 bacterium]